MLALIRNNPLFLRYWVSTWASELGDWLRNMTLMYMVLELSNGSAVAMSITMFSEFAPIFLFGSIVGVLADRWNRKKTIIGANLFRAGMVVVFIVAMLMKSLVLIYIGAFLCAIGTLFFRAPGSAFLMQFVDKDDRKTAASLRQLSMSVMILLGPVIGTSIYMVAGAGWTLATNILLFLINALIVMSIKLKTEEEQVKDRLSLSSVWLDMKSGMNYSWHHPIVKPILYASIFFGFGAGMIQVLEIFVITEFLGLPEEMMAILASVQGAGMLLSSVVINKIKLPMDRFISYGMIVMGIGLSMMVAYPSFYATAFALVVFSVGQIGLNIGMATLAQTKVAYEYQGRVGMTINTVMMGFLTTALLMSGWLHEFFAIQPLILGGGALVTLGGIICFIMFLKLADVADANEPAAMSAKA